MKRILGLLALSVLLLSSCQTMKNTARTARTESSLYSATVVDIEPATEKRVSCTINPTRKERRGGLNNVKQAVESKLLEKYDADILLDPQYVISKKRSVFGSKITSISVSGRPACYKNFRTLHDSVWSNPAFRGVTPLPSFYALPMSRKGGRSDMGQMPVFRPKGVASYLSLALGSALVEEEEEGYDSEGFGIGALYSVGYQFNPYFFLGAGAGVMFEDAEENTFIPLFANARVNFSKKKNTFFLDYKVGYGIGLDTDGGVFVGAAIGYSFGNYDIALQTLVQEYVDDFGTKEDFDLTSSTVGVSFGLRF